MAQQPTNDELRAEGSEGETEIVTDGGTDTEPIPDERTPETRTMDELVSILRQTDGIARADGGRGANSVQWLMLAFPLSELDEEAAWSHSDIPDEAAILIHNLPLIPVSIAREHHSETDEWLPTIRYESAETVADRAGEADLTKANTNTEPDRGLWKEPGEPHNETSRQNGTRPNDEHAMEGYGEARLNPAHRDDSGRPMSISEQTRLPERMTLRWTGKLREHLNEHVDKRTSYSHTPAYNARTVSVWRVLDRRKTQAHIYTKEEATHLTNYLAEFVHNPSPSWWHATMVSVALRLINTIRSELENMGMADELDAETNPHSDTHSDPDSEADDDR